MSSNGPLEVAADAYYWKPGTAWFRALELDAYLAAGAKLTGPTLDLGCGDGRVAGMLVEMGLVDAPVAGLDLSARQLAEARRGSPHRLLVRAEGGRLPFRDGSFSSILCNGVLCSIADGPDATLAEIHRVLAPGGTIVATFPTDRFLDVLFWPKVLRVWPRVRTAYRLRVNRRQPHFTAEPVESWRGRFEATALPVERAEKFLSPRAGEIWNVLAMHVLRFLGLLKLAPGSPPAALARAATVRLLRGPFHRERGRPGEGYALVVARRRPGG